MTLTTFNPAQKRGQPTNKGAWAPGDNTAPEGSLPVPAGDESSIVFIPTVFNDRTRVNRAVWDEDAEEAFTNGQCLAFARALAEATGEDTIACATRPDGSLLHAWVDTDAETSVDATGSHDVDQFYNRRVLGANDIDCWFCEEGEYCDNADEHLDQEVIRFITIPAGTSPEELQSQFGNTLPEQQWDLATEMVPLFTTANPA